MSDDLEMQTIRERDYNADMADKLAQGIAEHFGQDIGEHSSSNCPWMRALEILNTKPEFAPCAGSAPSVQAVSSDAGERVYSHTKCDGNGCSDCDWMGTSDASCPPKHMPGPADLSSLNRYDQRGCFMVPDPAGDYCIVSDVRELLASQAESTGEKIKQIRRLVLAHGTATHQLWPLAPMALLEKVMEAVTDLAAHAGVPDSNAGERERFEAWARKECEMPEHVAVNWGAEWVMNAWEGWQARAAHAGAQTAPRKENDEKHARADDQGHAENAQDDAGRTGEADRAGAHQHHQHGERDTADQHGQSGSDGRGAWAAAQSPLDRYLEASQELDAATGNFYGQRVRQSNLPEYEAKFQHEITELVMDHIDRMNDVCEQDTADNIVSSFTRQFDPIFEAYMAAKFPDREATITASQEANRMQRQGESESIDTPRFRMLVNLCCDEWGSPEAKYCDVMDLRAGKDLIAHINAWGARRAAGGDAVRDGWQLVPIEPTEEMIIAFAETWFSKVRPIDDPGMEDAYAAMLAAAPSADNGEGK